MTEEEAIKEVVRLNKIGFKKFCPLIQDVCNPNCVCYGEAWTYLQRPGSTDYIVKPPHCNNAMFDGERYCNHQY